jgi:hypothetical protein
MRFGFIGCGLMAAMVLAGCASQPEPGKKEHDPEAKKDDSHSHGTGPHGGAVADWGKYHVEFTVDHKKQQATVHVLKADMKTAAPIKADRLLLKIKEPAFEVELKPDPQTKDPKGTASRFVGTHERLGKEQEFEGTIVGTVDGKTLTAHFKEEPEEKK